MMKSSTKLNSAVFPGMQGGPLMHAIAAKAVAFKKAMEPEFRTYQELVVKNAQVMASVFVERGFKIVSGGTDNHLMLVDLVAQGITGKAADAALGESYITVNKNAVPNDPQSPFVTSGIRIGTPAVTTRGFVESDCRALAHLICDVLDNLDDEGVKGESVIKLRRCVIACRCTVKHPVDTGIFFAHIEFIHARNALSSAKVSGFSSSPFGTSICSTWIMALGT